MMKEGNPDYFVKSDSPYKTRFAAGHGVRKTKTASSDPRKEGFVNATIETWNKLPLDLKKEVFL